MSGTQDLQWLLTRRTSSYIVKQKGLGKIFTREPGNLTQVHSYKQSTLVNDKAVLVTPAPSGRGVVIATKNSKVASNKVAGSFTTQTIKKGGSRRTAGAVANIVGKRGYRSDLLKDAVARASLIRRSERSRKAQPLRKSRYAKATAALTQPTEA